MDPMDPPLDPPLAQTGTNIRVGPAFTGPGYGSDCGSCGCVVNDNSAKTTC